MGGVSASLRRDAPVILAALLLAALLYPVGGVREGDAELLRAIADPATATVPWPPVLYRLPYLLAGGLGRFIGLEASLTLWWLVGMTASLSVLVRLARLFVPASLLVVVVVALVVLDARAVSIGNFALFPPVISPQFFATPFLLLTVYFFFAGRPAEMMVGYVLVLLLHFPSALYLGLVLGLYHLARPSALLELLRHRLAFAGSLLAVLTYLVVLLRTTTLGDLPPSSLELFKFVTYGHVSILANLQISPRYTVFSIVALAVLIGLAVVLARREPQRAELRKARDLALISAGVLVAAFVLVDLLNVQFVYRLLPLYSQFHPSLLFLLVAGAGASHLMKRGWSLPVAVPTLIAAAMLVKLVHVFVVSMSAQGAEPAWRDLAAAARAGGLGPEHTVLFPFGSDLGSVSHFAPAASAFSVRILQAQPVNDQSRAGAEAAWTAFDDFMGPDFLPRLAALVAERRYDEALRHWRSGLTERWALLDADRLRILCRDYGITHVVREAALPLALTPVAEAGSLRLYALQDGCPAASSAN